MTQASKESHLLGQVAFRVPLLLPAIWEKTVQDSNAKLCESSFFQLKCTSDELGGACV